VEGAGSRTPDAAVVPAPVRGAHTGRAAIEVLRSLPPEAIAKVVDIVGDVIRTRATLAQKHADFLHELDILHKKAGDRDRAMTLVSELLLNAEINDEAKMKLVDAICQLALR
jgi:hypothetical protein